MKHFNQISKKLIGIAVILLLLLIPITVIATTNSDGNVTGVGISSSDITYAAPEITLLDGRWNQLGGELSTIYIDDLDLEFYSDAEHNTPSVLLSSITNGATMLKWNGSLEQWDVVGSQNFSGVGTFGIALSINDDDVPYAAYNEVNDFKANVEALSDNVWLAVGSPNFSPGLANPIDMQLESDGVTPVVAFRDGANSSLGTVMRLGATDWEYVGSAGSATPWVAERIGLVLDSNDAPWVAYENGSIGAMKYTGNGISGWEYAGGVTSFVSNAYQMSMAIDSVDTVYIAFRDSAHSQKITVMKHSGALTTTWQTVGSAGFSTCGISTANLTNIAISHDDVPYVVYINGACGSSTSDAVVMKYSGAGASGWETVGEDGSGVFGNPVRHPVINLNNDGTPYVAFSGRNASNDYRPVVMQFDAYPVIMETAVSMSEDGSPIPFDLSLRGFDENGDTLTWGIAAQGTHGSAAIASTIGTTGTVTVTLAYTPTANFNGTDNFVVQLDDGTETVTATVTVSIDPVNDAPTAYFPDQTVAQDETVTLYGRLSHDIDGDTLTAFHWTQTGGTAVSFTDNISKPTFIAPTTPVTLTFNLVVTDSGGLTDDYDGTVWVVDGEASTAVTTDTVTIFTPPTAPLTITIPIGGVGQPISLLFADAAGGNPPSADQQFVGDPFSLMAYVDGVLQPNFTFDAPVTITLSYSDGDIDGLSESTMGLLYWNGSAWTADGILLISRNPSANQITVTVNHLTDFAFIAMEVYAVYLPMIVK